MPNMPPLLTLLQQRLKQSPANPLATHYRSEQCVVRISMRPSRLALLVRSSAAALAMYAAWQASPPLYLLLLLLAWIFACLCVAWQQRLPWLEIHDEGQHWLLVTSNGAERAQRRIHYFRSAYLIVLSFSTRCGAVRYVSIWCDAVTPAAFSWLHARISLTQTNTAAENVATSAPGHLFEHN